MLMIVMHHCIVHGLGIDTSAKEISVFHIDNAQVIAADIINCFCICAVNCFVLISGFFGIRTNAKKIISLVLSLLFYTILFSVVPLALEGDISTALKSCLFLSHSQYWFVIDYLFLMVLTPIINVAFERLPEKMLRMSIFGLLIISCYFGFIWNHTANNNGYTLLQFILMYCIGRMIARSGFSLHRSRAVTVYIVCSLACGLLMWGLWHYGYAHQSWKITYYNNPLLILSAIALFMIFKTFRFQSAKINRYARYALGIYLFQSSFFISKVLYDFAKDLSGMNLGVALWLALLLLSAVTCLFALCFDTVRVSVVNLLTSKVRLPERIRKISE